VSVKIDLFTRSPVRAGIGEFQTGKIQVSVHEGRIGPQYWETVPTEKDVFICGPNDFGDVAVESLRAVGVPIERIHREGFY
jgi:ferredoxin-NADP reductase